MNRADEKKRALRHYSGVLRELRRDQFIRRWGTVAIVLGLIFLGITIANHFAPATLR